MQVPSQRRQSTHAPASRALLHCLLSAFDWQKKTKKIGKLISQLSIGSESAVKLKARYSGGNS
jgi:hypothetical protein